jgi:hypothetical protein
MTGKKSLVWEKPLVLPLGGLAVARGTEPHKCGNGSAPGHICGNGGAPQINQCGSGNVPPSGSCFSGNQGS